jgi:hypothetical protein
MLVPMRCVSVVGVFLAACGSGASTHAGQDAGDDDASIDAASDAPPDGPSSGIGGPPLGTCTDGSGSDWCWVLPRPQGYPITAVWANSTSDIWFSALNLFHFDGTSWTETVTPSGSVEQFAGSASNDLWAVSNGEIIHWNGTTWSLSAGALHGNQVLAVFGANDVWSVNADTANQWNGSTWTAHPGPGFLPLAIGGDANNLIAVSATGTIAKLLGTVWGIADASSHPGSAAAVIDPTHVVVVQDHDVLFWNSGTWTAHTPPVLYGPWNRIAARSFNDLWIGSSGARYHWNGTTWTAATEASPSFVSSLWEAPNGDLFTGDYHAQVRRWNGTSWTNLTEGPGGTQAVWGLANNDIWAIGATGYTTEPFAIHWDGATWTATQLQGADIVHSVNAIWGAATNDVWIAGGDYQGSDVEQRQMLHWNGTSWTHFKLGTEDAALPSEGFRLIRGFAANDIFAASPYKLYHYDGTSWSPVTVPVTRISDVFGSSASDLYVAGYNTLAHWDGSVWTTKTAPISIFSGVAISPTAIWLMGTSTTTPSETQLVHYDGTFFVPVANGLCSYYQNAIARRGGDIYTCEGGGIMKRPVAFGGTPTPYAVARTLFNSWFAPDGHLYVAGRGPVMPGLMIHAP